MALSVIKNFEFEGFPISVYGSIDKPMFKAKDIGDLLGLSNINWNIGKIPPEWRCISKTYTNNVERNMTFINEKAVYKLVFRSNKPFADDFTNKVCDILETIRKTGQYQLRPKNITKHLTFRMETEHDLHTRIVNFIDTYYNGEILYTANLGEQQDTSAKRVDAYCKGYLAGSPDLEIKEQTRDHIGLCIEFKSPTGAGKLTTKQIDVHKEFESRGYKIICSNDYEFILLQVKDYLDNRRYPCEFCKRKRKLFCTQHSREQHYRYFHRIK